MENIKKLFDLEMTIYDFYQKLSDCEMLGISLDDSIINTLKYLIQDEERLIASLDIDNSEEIIKRALKNIKDRNNYKEKTAGLRMIKKIRSYKKIPEEPTINDKLSLIVSLEYNDIFFSFLDEAISKAKGSLREKLIKEKYEFLFLLDKENEERLLDRKYHTDYSLYLTSELSAGFIGVSKDKLDEFKMIIAYELLKEIKKEFKKSQSLSEIDKMILAIRKRSVMLLFDDIFFRSLRPSQDDKEYNEFYVKDREGHKKISLRLK